ncbi:hypothetical protein CJU90_1389 [Yarrowia sp. C11]|nr:hypothetical protein CKK34_0115 [Yarrowia sp. E02]KAG5371371.1 hypothetical protein CJU90_1389 [Yarrowia sp. C11]
MTSESIRAEVVFESPTVFGGDDVRAVITFRNVSKVTSVDNTDLRSDVRHSTDTRSRSDSFRNVNNSRSEDQPRGSMDGWRDRIFGLLSTDYEPLPSNRLSRARSIRRSVQPPVRSPHGTRETLIMGTCRIEGHFVVDPEVVDVARLEHIRNRGAAMGLAHLSEVDNSNDIDNPQGITKMIWGLLGDESNGTQGTGAQSSDSGEGLPIYSSASSLLFPALTLNPGESKAFYYKCTLPRELPPSYRGKAVRIYYSLVVSTQRGESCLVDDPGMSNGDTTPAKPSLKSRAHRLVAPFRVFQYVDDDGDSIPHQMDNPIGGEQSAVAVKELPDSSRETMSSVFGLHHVGPSTKPGPKSREQLMEHIKALRTSHDPYASHDQSMEDEEDDAGTSAGAHINRLVQSNGLISKTLVPKTTFHISRNSKYIATLSLSKPLYRIGDSMVLSFDFSGSQTPCYHVTASLETTETIHRSYLHGYDWDDSLLSGWGNPNNPGNGRRSSVGSDGSGRRLSGSRDPTMIPLPSTRRIYAQEMTFIYDSRDRVTFDMVVPATAASQFAATKICMDWSLKLTFVTHFADKKGAQMIGGSKSKTSNLLSTVQTNIPRPAVSEPGSPVMDRKRSIAGDFVFPNTNGNGNNINAPGDGGTPGNILNITDSAVIAPVDYDSRGTTYGPKDSFSCEHFSCKIPLNIYSTDKDISSVIGVSRGTSVYSAGLW